MHNATSSLSDEVSNVIRQRTNLAYLYSSVAEGMIHASKGFVKQSSGNGQLTDSADWIRIVRLNKVTFKKWLGYKDNYHSRGRDSAVYLSLYNKNFSSYDNNLTPQTLFYMGVNVDNSLKLTGYHYNVCDIFNARVLAERGSENTLKRIPAYIYKLIYVTEKNFLLGFIDKDAVLYLDSAILAKLKEQSVEDFNRVVDRVISVYANANSIFFKLNTQGIGDDIVEKVVGSVVTKLNYDVKDCTVIQPDHLDLFEDFSLVTVLINKIKKAVSQQVDQVLAGTRWGINNQYGYKALIDELLTTKITNEETLKQKAFMQGLLYGSKFELAGWIVSERSFNPNDAVCWEKDVEIVPCRFFWGGKMYNINPDSETWQNPYKITKLFVTSSGVMYCEGKHPNVSGGKVCMGDISGKIKMSDIKQLQANLARCESLLTSINYDSPYDSSKRELMLQHATLVGGGSNGEQQADSEYVADGTIIQDVTFEEEETDPDMIDAPDDSDMHGPDHQDGEIQPIVFGVDPDQEQPQEQPPAEEYHDFGPAREAIREDTIVGEAIEGTAINEGTIIGEAINERIVADHEIAQDRIVAQHEYNAETATFGTTYATERVLDTDGSNTGFGG